MSSRKQSSSGRQTPGGRRPIHEFSLPDGKLVVVGLPEDVAALRTRYAASSGPSASPSSQAVGPETTGNGCEPDSTGPAPAPAEPEQVSQEKETAVNDVVAVQPRPTDTSADGDGDGDGDGTTSPPPDTEEEECPATDIAIRIHHPAGQAGQARADAEVEVEVVIHGSEEHQTFLRETHSHAHARREELRRRHGEAFEEWERVTEELRDIGAQIERLADHSSSLNASFAKFGYSAHLRTFGDGLEALAGGAGASGGGKGGGGGGTDSSAASTFAGGSGSGSGSSTMAESEWSDPRRGGTTMKLFKRPVVKQYFHRGLLWRASALTSVMSFELFFDLLYVGILHVNGEHLSEKPNGMELLRFVVTFCMSWKLWQDVASVIAWFETDDVLQRLEILVLIACLLGLTTNMISTFDTAEGHDTFTFLVGFYLAARLLMALYYVVTSALVPMVKGTLVLNAVLIVVPAALWIGATALEMPRRLGLVVVALVLDIFGSSITVAVYRHTLRRSGRMTGPLSSRFARWFEFFPGLNIEHKVERTGAFVSLVFGYSVVGSIFQNQGYGLNAFFGKAVLGLVQAFVFNWLYFEIDGENIHVHAIRKSVVSATIWQFAHLPFIMSYVAAAAGLSKLVVATDVANAPGDSLTDFYHHKAEDHISQGIRLFYCVGLGLSLFCMSAIALSHEHKLPPTCRLPKAVRVGNRLAVSAVLCCLGATEDRLNSLELVATTTSLVVWVLLVETWGKSCPEETFFGENEGCKRRYLARCSRRQLEECMGSDGEVDVVKLEKGQLGGSEAVSAS